MSEILNKYQSVRRVFYMKRRFSTKLDLFGIRRYTYNIKESVLYEATFIKVDDIHFQQFRRVSPYRTIFVFHVLPNRII